MAKKESTTATPRAVLTDISRGKFAPIYILMGEEPYYLDRIAGALETHVISEDEKDFNSNIYYGADVDLEEVMGVARQYPMMAERRLVMIRETQAMHQAKAMLEKLEPYMLHPSPTTVFVVIYKGGDLTASSAIMKAAKASGAVIVSSPQIRDYQIAPHIKDYVTAKKLTIDDKAVTMLKEFLGTSLSKIFGEIDKLIIAAPEGTTRITPQLIEENIGISNDFNNFELTNAIVANNYKKAMTIIDYFTRNPKTNPTVTITGSLFGLYYRIVVAHLSSDKSDAAILKGMKGTSPYMLKQVRTAMGHISLSRAIASIHAIREFDRKSKGVGSQANEYQLLKELIFKLFTLK